MRHSSWLLGLCIAIAGSALLSPATAQAPAPDGEEWVLPRTSEGHPDLQGNWSNSTLTPFERRDGMGPVFTWEQVAQLERGEGVCPPNPGTVECGRAERQGASNEARLSGNEYNEVYWERGTRVAIVNGEPRASLVTHPANGRVPARTPGALRLAQERRDFRSQFGQYDHPELRPSAERCILFGSPLGPPMQPVGAYNSNYTIVQTADHLMILSEMVHDVRIIRIGEPRPMAEGVRPYFGNSWGRWDGDALVVETTNIRPDQRIRGAPISEDAIVRERFTRADEETIVYEFTVEDPAMFAGTWGGEVPFNRFDANLYEYACHEGNYALSNVLSGARYQERQTGRD